MTERRIGDDDAWFGCHSDRRTTGDGMKLEQSVARHYTHGSFEPAILEALTAAGKDLDRLAPSDLAPVDEFHIGGRQATADLAAQIGFGAGLHLLDIGCGLGGASRYFAHERGCRVTGIDLTEEYVRWPKRSRGASGWRTGLHTGTAARSTCRSRRETFDGAYMLHVGMNIDDKKKAFAEVRRVLKPGGSFAIYDVMRESGEGELSFPVPWAASPEASFVESAATYRRLPGGCRLCGREGTEPPRIRHRVFPSDACPGGRDRRTAAARLANSDGCLGAAEGREHDRQPRAGLIAPTEIVSRAI